MQTKPPAIGVKVTTRVRAGKLAANHNEGISVVTKVRAGRITANHNQSR